MSSERSGLGVLLALCVSVAPGSALAQDSGPTIGFIVGGGQQRLASPNPADRFGPERGALAGMFIGGGADRRLDAILEVLIASRGAVNDVSAPQNWSAWTIDVPLLLRANVLRSASRRQGFYGLAGLGASFRISDLTVRRDDGSDVLLFNAPNRLDILAIAGAGYQIGAFGFEARYTRGLRGILESSLTIPSLKSRTVTGLVRVRLNAPSGTGAASSTHALWELEPYGGWAAGGTPSSGTAIPLPADGQPFTAPSGETARAVSSWFYGEGPALVPAIARIDSVLSTSGASGRRAATAGARVTRWLTPRLGIEGAIGYERGALQFSDATRTTLDAARESFVPAFNAIFAEAPATFGSPDVTATLNVTNDPAHLTTTGAVVLTMGQPRLQPYVTGGVGIDTRLGDPMQADLIGEFRVEAPNGGPIRNRNTITLRYAAGAHRLVVLAGGGVRWFASPTSGLRLDVRATMTGGDETLVLDSTGAVFGGSPDATIELPLSPIHGRLVFSNDERSTLSGPDGRGFEVFNVSGSRWRVSATAGWFWRF